MKLHKVTSKDDLRPAMMHVFVNQNEIAATDGHVLVVLKKELIFGDLETPDMLIKSKDWQKFTSKKIMRIEFEDELLISYDKKNEIIAIIKPSINSDYKFPKYENVIPEGLEKIDTIGFNLQKMKLAYEGLGTKKVKCQFFGTEKGMMLRPLDVEMSGCYAMIMPYRLD